MDIVAWCRVCKRQTGWKK